MALTYVESGTVSVAGSVKSSSSSTGISSGPTVNWSDTISLPNANLDGVFVGSFTFTASGTTPVNLRYATSTPLSEVTPTAGAFGFPFSGFTAPTANSRLIGYHLELLTNSTWTSGAGTQKEIVLSDESSNDIAVLGVPGDCICAMGQTAKTAITTANYFTMTPTGSATFTMKVVFLYRDTGVAT